MKAGYIIFAAFLAVFNQMTPSAVPADAWERVLVSATGAILWAGSPEGCRDTVCAGTGEGLFVSVDSGATWIKEDTPPEVKDVAMAVFDGGDIHFISGGGLYIGKKGLWSRISGLSGLKGVCVRKDADGKRTVVAWSCEKIYFLSGDTVQDLSAASPWGSIDDAASCAGNVYVISGSDVFVFNGAGTGWKKIQLYPGNVKEEVPENIADAAASEDELNGNIEETGSGAISRIRACPDGSILAGTESGIYRLATDGEVIERIDTAGIDRNGLMAVAQTTKSILAAAGGKVFAYSKESGAWIPVFEPAGEGEINYVFSDVTDPGRVWAAAGASLYRGSIGSCREGTNDDEDMRSKDDPAKEPSITEVQKMAVEYAEVSPKKIEAWRAAAKWKAVMPKLSVDFGEDRNDNVEVYTSATTSYSYVGPEERSDGWDVGLQWDLSDLVWNEAQTSIDVRSKLMVQLRNEVLQEVTRLYFERKRIIAGTGQGAWRKGHGAKGKGQGLPLRSPTGDNIGKGEAGSMEERDIRVEELTAHIDALTGGRFSEAVERGKPQDQRSAVSVQRADPNKIP